MSNLQTLYKDKPYFFVPFVHKVHRKHISERQYSISNGYSGSFHLTLTAMTPLIFGEGDLSIGDNGHVMHSLSRENGNITLAGSSFKGMLRSFFESITHSCTLLSPRWQSQLLPNNTHTPCQQSIRNTQTVCPACSLFGCLCMKGKLRFSSFQAKSSQIVETNVVPNLQSPYKDYPRDQTRGWGNERLYYASFKGINGTDTANLDKATFFNMKKSATLQSPQGFYGRKLYKHSLILEKGKDALSNTYESLPVGSILTGEILFEGLTDEELASLAFALGIGWERPIYYKLGYAKPAYFGSVKIDVCLLPASGNTLHLGRPLPNDIDKLGTEYRLGADEELRSAIEMIESYWSAVDGKNQWQTIENRRNY